MIQNPTFFKEVTNTILEESEDSINLDQADLKMVMSYEGLVLVGQSEALSEDAVSIALSQALGSALGKYSLHNARAILIHFYMHPDAKFSDISKAMKIIGEGANAEADIIFGTKNSSEISLDYAKVSIILTGL